MTSTTTGGPQTSKRRRISLKAKPVMAVVITAIALWFILANTAKAHIRLWIPTVTAPMWLVLLVTFVGGMVVSMLLQRRGKGKGQQAG
jgi:uncharacterized integral membrane protein